MALNSDLELDLGGPVDPLSLTSASVSAWREDGRPLPAIVTTASGRIVLQLDVDEALLADPPAEVRVRLLGLPSPHALRTLDGRRLAGSAQAVFRVAGVLEPRGPSPARLVALDGLPPRPELELAPEGRIVLRFEGVLDPSTLGPGACPLFPMEQGLVLSTPIFPEARWRCTGERFELTLSLAGRRGRFQLDLRRVRWRDLAGGIPEPALVTEVLAP
ncbi:MAG TPA: hypothetical protein VFD43_05780 [Planctomycetota bacterium]|nr:hypothetical protein [Planctomycetota bacterium]